jgi:hypothetical protein
MATDEECVGYARECVRLAGLATDQELREQLLQMARNWMAEASTSAARMRLRSSPLHPVERSHLHHVMVDDGAGSKRA